MRTVLFAALVLSAAAAHAKPFTDWHAYGCVTPSGMRFTGVADYRRALPKGCARYVRFTHGKAVHHA